MIRPKLPSNGCAPPSRPTPLRSLSFNNRGTGWIRSSSLVGLNTNWSASFNSAPQRFLKISVIHNFHSFPQRFTERKKNQKRKNEGLLLLSWVTSYFAR